MAENEKNEDHSRAVSEGRQKARRIREKWLDALRTGEVQVDYLIEASRAHETRSLSTVLLQDILMTLPGWTAKTASEVLLQHGFGPKENLQNIRKSPSKVELFKVLMAGTPGQWRPRPKMPAGWPFRGKLDELLANVEQDARKAALPSLSFADVERLHHDNSESSEEPGDVEEAPEENGDLLENLSQLIQEHQGSSEKPVAEETPTPRSSGVSFFNT